MLDLKNLPHIYLTSRNGDGDRYPKITPPSQEDIERYPEPSSLTEAFNIGAEIRETKRVALAARLQDRQELNKLSTETPQATNKLFLESLQNSLQENILSLKELSEFSQNNKTAISMLNQEKSAFLSNLKHAHSLGLLEVVADPQEGTVANSNE